MEVAERLNHPYFNGDELSDIAKKKRVRQRAREARVNPVARKHNIWLFHEDDVESLMKCHSKLRNETDRHTGRSQGRSAVNAYERVQELLTRERPN
jgi:hypothetical protein